MAADLHIHTDYSDGKNTPGEIVEMAAQIGLQAVAITDHEALGGIAEAEAAGRELGVEIVPGVEISTVFGNSSIHILGYWLDLQNSLLLEKLAFWQEKRIERVAQIIAKLQKFNLNIEIDRVLELAGRGSVGRPHIARVLMEMGAVCSYEESFYRYLGQQGAAYVPRYPVEPVEAVRLIKMAGGVAVMAHPGLAGCDAVLPQLLEAGLAGLEVKHPAHSQSQRQHYVQLAEQYHLIPTAGSDYHGLGHRDSVRLGSETVEYQTVLDLKQAACWL